MSNLLYILDSGIRVGNKYEAVIPWRHNGRPTAIEINRFVEAETVLDGDVERELGKKFLTQVDLDAVLTYPVMFNESWIEVRDIEDGDIHIIPICLFIELDILELE